MAGSLYLQGGNHSLNIGEGKIAGLAMRKTGSGRVVGYDIQLKTIQHSRINKFMTGERNDAEFERPEGGISAGLKEVVA